MGPLKNLREQNEQLREDLIEIIKREGKSIVVFAKEVGISHSTLRKFIVDGQEIRRLPTLIQIEKFIDLKKSGK